LYADEAFEREPGAKLRIGLFSKAAIRRNATLDDVVAEARAFESEGFDFISYPNVFGLDAMTVATVVGRETDRIELLTGVVPTPPRHPVAMAQQALSVQAACSGRFTLGIGLSHKVVIDQMFGLSYARPAMQMREYLEVLSPLLEGRAASFEGELYRVHAEFQVAGVERVSLLVAALGPKMLELTGERADGTYTWMTGVRTLGQHTVPTISEAAGRVGRPMPRVVAGLPTGLVADVAAARAWTNENFSMYNSIPSYRSMMDREGPGSQPGDVAVLGDESELRARLRNLQSAGVSDLCAVLNSFEPGCGARTRDFLATEIENMRGA
jgi:5,10-methylenetetrahydromethanopterin reductase